MDSQMSSLVHQAHLSANQCDIKVPCPSQLCPAQQEHSPILGDFTETGGARHLLDSVPVLEIDEAVLGSGPHGPQER